MPGREWEAGIAVREMECITECIKERNVSGIEIGECTEDTGCTKVMEECRE